LSPCGENVGPSYISNLIVGAVNTSSVVSSTVSSSVSSAVSSGVVSSGVVS